MNKIFFPVAAAAVLLLTTSCGADKTGTSFEVVDANEDESVNPAHIRGYSSEPPGMGGVPKNPSQYYPFNIKTLPADVQQQLAGNVAVQMVTTYYSNNRTLADLAEEYYPTDEARGTTDSPATPESNNNSGNANTNTGGAGSETTENGNGNGDSGNGSGNTTDQN